MESIALLAETFALRQALPVRLIVLQRDLTDMVQQFVLTFGHEQHLIGRASTQSVG